MTPSSGTNLGFAIVSVYYDSNGAGPDGGMADPARGSRRDHQRDQFRRAASASTTAVRSS